MRQPRTKRDPDPPSAFQQGMHKNQPTSFFIRSIGILQEGKTNFLRLFGTDRATGALVPCLVQVHPNLLRPNLLNPIALRRKKQ